MPLPGRTPLLFEAEAALRQPTRPKTTPSLFGRITAAGQSAAERLVPAIRRRRERREQEAQNAETVKRAKARMDTYDEIEGHRDAAKESARSVLRYKKIGGPTGQAGAALHTVSTRSASQRLKKAIAGYKPEVAKPNPDTPDWAHRMVQHAHDIKTVEGHPAVHVVGPKHPPEGGGTHPPHEFSIRLTRPEDMGEIARARSRTYYTADKLLRGPLLIEGLAQRKSTPSTIAGFASRASRALGQARTALQSVLKGRTPQRPPSAPVRRKRQPRVDPKAETQPIINLPGEALHADPDVQAVRNRNVRIAEAAQSQYVPSNKRESGTFDPTEPSWFKKPLEPQTHAVLSQHFKSLRDPKVVARLKAAGQQGAANVRTTMARKQARPPAPKQTPVPGPPRPLPSTQTSMTVQRRQPTAASEAPTRRMRRPSQRPAGHETQIVKVLESFLPRRNEQKVTPHTVVRVTPRRSERKMRGSTVAVLPTIPDYGKEEKELGKPISHGFASSRRGDTKRLPKITSDLLVRSPLLQELVTPGGVFATGLRPGSPLRSHPRDARHIPNPPRKSAVTTANVGHTANTGAWVPDQKKRKIEPPRSRLRILIQKDIRDPITKELEAQPAFPMIQREQLLGEACASAHIEASSWYRNGNTLDRPEDDLAYAMEEWRKQCPRYEESSHAAFCSRCDNSFPSFIGGANVLRGDQNWVRRFPLEPFPEPIKPREGPKVSIDFGRV